MKHLLKTALLGLALAFGANAAMADCGKVQIANMNWASAQLMAEVDKIILAEGYGCEVELVPGDTMPTFTSLNEKGEPDVAPELWINAVREPLKIAMDEGRLKSANDGPISGLGEGWWVPPYVQEKHPELKTVLDVLKRPDLFPDAEDPSKGAFVGCPAGWGCQLTNANLFRGFKMAEMGWKLVDPGSAAGLDGSMSKAVNRGENWFGYYWSPTALIGRHKMVKLDFGVPFVGSEHWDGCIVKPEQECADPQAVVLDEVGSAYRGHGGLRGERGRCGHGVFQEPRVPRRRDERHAGLYGREPGRRGGCRGGVPARARRCVEALGACRGRCESEGNVTRVLRSARLTA